MIELAILGLLKESDLHGYELRRRLREELGPLFTVSFGSVYPALARLEADGALRQVSPPEPGGPGGPAGHAGGPVPSTGSLSGERALWQKKAFAKSDRRSGRSRRVYTITPAGEALLAKLLDTTESDAEDGRAFAVRIAFARYLAPAARARLMQRRLAGLERRLDTATASAEHARGADPYVRALAERSVALIEAEVRWLGRLIEVEVGAPVAPAPGADPEDRIPNLEEASPT